MVHRSIIIIFYTFYIMEKEPIMPENEGEENEADKDLIIGDDLSVKTKGLDRIEKKWDEHERND